MVRGNLKGVCDEHFLAYIWFIEKEEDVLFVRYQNINYRKYETDKTDITLGGRL